MKLDSKDQNAGTIYDDHPMTIDSPLPTLLPIHELAGSNQ
jgi:hypothetical protein